MSYLLFQYIRKLLEAEDNSENHSSTAMGNAVSSVTSLAGVHGPSVGIAIGVSLGVLLCLAAIQYYQNRQLKKKVKALMLVTPEAQIYTKPSAQNPFAYRNLGYCQNPNAVNNNQANQVAQMNPGGVPAV